MEQKTQIRDVLPIHDTPDAAGPRSGLLKVDGLVAQCLELTPADLEQLPQQDMTDDFTCLEGWTVREVEWRGVPLGIVLRLVKPSPEARYVQASAAGFSISLPMDLCERVLLATRLYGEPLPAEHGGPIRLVVPDGQCFTQIKWLDHLELRTEPTPNTAEAIALGRLNSTPTVG